MRRNFTYANVCATAALVLAVVATGVAQPVVEAALTLTGVHKEAKRADRRAGKALKKAKAARKKAGAAAIAAATANAVATAALPANGKATDSDRLDGLDSTAFLPAGGTATNSALLDGLDSSDFLRSDATAVNADKLDGLDSTALRATCPASTTLRVGVCVEDAARLSGTFTEALNTCTDAGRRLPSVAELWAFFRLGSNTSTAQEWTGNAYDESGTLKSMLVQRSGATVSTFGASVAATTPFRCAVPPLEG